ASAVTVVMRQGGFAVGIAVLGAVLRTQGSAISYIWVFSAAAMASAAGLGAALVFLPAPAGGAKKKQRRECQNLCPSRHFAAAQQPRRFGSKADINFVASRHRAYWRTAWLRRRSATFALKPQVVSKVWQQRTSPTGCTLWRPSQFGSKHSF